MYKKSNTGIFLAAVFMAATGAFANGIVGVDAATFNAGDAASASCMDFPGNTDTAEKLEFMNEAKKAATDNYEREQNRKGLLDEQEARSVARKMLLDLAEKNKNEDTGTQEAAGDSTYYSRCVDITVVEPEGLVEEKEPETLENGTYTVKTQKNGNVEMKAVVEKLNKLKKLQEKKRKERKKQEAALMDVQIAEEALCRSASYNVPDGEGACDSTVRTYMPYTAVTNVASEQYALLNGPAAWTDVETGLRMVGDRYCIAVGSGYSQKIGTKINLVLADGSIIRCITGDAKADEHTDSSHRYQKYDGSVAEFIVDYQYFNRSTNMNPVNAVLGTSSAIVKIVAVG